VPLGLEQLAEAADGALSDQDLGERHLARAVHKVGAALGVLGEVHLAVVDSPAREERLGLAAEAAGLGRVDDHPVPVRHGSESLWECPEASRQKPSSSARSATA